MNTHLVESLYNVSQVHPRLARVVYLVEEVISKQLHEVAVTSFGPLRVTREPAKAPETVHTDAEIIIICKHKIMRFGQF